jgi:hypothetical protein
VVVRALLMMVVAQASLASCSSVDPTAEEKTGTSTSALTDEDVSKLLHGSSCFSPQDIPRLICTAFYESTCNPRKPPHLNKDGTWDYGLFQINSVHLGDPGCPPKGKEDDLFDPVINTTCACTVYRMQGLDGWYGYKNNKNTCDKKTDPCATNGKNLVCGSSQLITSGNGETEKCPGG